MSSPEVLKTIGEKLIKCNRAANSDNILIEDAPEWLSIKYMEMCLRSYYNDDKLKVLKMLAKPALAKGENYGGVLTRVKAEFKLSDIESSPQISSYIIKTSFEGNEFACKTMEPYDIFNREIKIYEEVLPKLKLLLKQIGDNEQIFAETMIVDKKKSALVFEDLNDRDFRMPDRLQGLNMDITKIVLRKLAKMHACSAVLNERQHKSLETYDCGMFNRHTDNYAPCFVGGLEACTRRVAKWPEFKQLSDKLIHLRPKYMELGKQVFDPLARHLNVFCHGDLWTNNILVKYDPTTNEALDVVIIDFQYAVWGSPAIDLFYLLNTSVTEDMLDNKQDELIQFYYQHLVETFDKLKYQPEVPSLFQFHQQLQEKSFYVLKTIGEKLIKCNRAANSDNILIEDAPEWLSIKYMEMCLRSYYNDDKLKVLKMLAKPALAKGENYGGVLTRVKAEFKLSDIESSPQISSYIIKTSFEGNEFACKTMEPYDIFNREIKIYEEVLPKLKLLLKQIGDNEQIFAETMIVDKKKSALVFEDLNDRDFRMPDRLQGLNMDITKIVLRKLAKMHACSAVLNERQHKSLETYDCGMFNRHTDNYAPCFVGGLEACTRRVAKWPEFKQLSDKLIHLRPKYMELGKQVFDPLARHLNVFCHGDLWTNNILVKYDPTTNEALDVVIIDFQYAVWGSPAIDLFYLLNTSVTEDMLDNKQDELIQFYYQHLVETFDKLKYQPEVPSLFQFHQQLQEKSFYAFHCCCVVQPIQRNIVTDDADFNALMQTDERAIRFKDTCYSNPYIQNILRKMLPVYEKRGLLDADQ